MSVDVQCIECGSANVRKTNLTIRTIDNIVYEYWECNDCNCTWKVREDEYEEIPEDENDWSILYERM